MNQRRVSSRLTIAAIDAEVVANGDAPLEVPFDLLDAAPAIAFEQLRNPPLERGEAVPPAFMARIVGLKVREGKGRSLPSLQADLEETYNSRFARARIATCKGTARTGSSSGPTSSVSRSKRW